MVLKNKRSYESTKDMILILQGAQIVELLWVSPVSGRKSKLTGPLDEREMTLCEI